MYELAEYLVTNLIGEDQKYLIEYDETTGALNIFVCKDAIGKVIGKQGRIAKAIRAIIKASAMKRNLRVNVEIKELEE